MNSFDVCQCGAPLQLREQPTPKPAGTEVLLKVLAAGVCHSDLHLWDGYYDLGGGKQLKLIDRGMKLPLTMGHEIVGEVVAFGPEAHGVKVGDERLVLSLDRLRRLRGVPTRRGAALRQAELPRRVHRPGGYSDHVMVPHPRYLLDIGDMPPEQAAPLACSGVTTYGALRKLGGLVQTEPVVIIGAGGLGLMCLAIPRRWAAPAPSCVDIDPAKRDAAKGPARSRSSTRRHGCREADHRGDRRRRLGGDRPRRLVRHGPARLDSLIKGGKLHRGRAVRRRHHPVDAVVPDAGDDAAGLLHRQPGRAQGADRPVRTAPLPLIPVQRRPLEQAYAALTDLKEGKVIGRTVLSPAG